MKGEEVMRKKGPDYSNKQGGRKAEDKELRKRKLRKIRGR